MMTTTTFPIISRRNEDGTWQEQDYTFRDWDFAVEDGADVESLTDWLRQIVADNGEGEWSASYNGVESEVVCTGPTTDDVYHIARDAVGDENVELVADDCGSLTLVAVLPEGGSVVDGSAMMVIGPGPEGGYTWTLYAAQDYDHQPMMERYLTTDGDSTVATLADEIRKQTAK